MRQLYFLFLFLHSTLPGIAQIPLNTEKVADSLTRVLMQPVPDSIKARANFHLIAYWLLKDTTKARSYLNEGKRLSQSIPYLKALAFSYEGYFYYASDIEKSEIAYRKADSALSPFHSPMAYRDRSDAIYKYAVIQQRKDDDEAYIDIVLNKAIPLAEKSGNNSVLGSQYMGIGIAFMNIEQYDKASIYLNNSIQVLKNAATEPSRLIAAYNRAGENYIHLRQYDSAKAILDAIRPLLAPYPQSELYAGYYLVEGLYYHHLEKYPAAITSFNKGMQAAGGPNKAYVIQEMLFAKVRSLVSAKKFEEAQKILLQFLNDEEVMSFSGNRKEVFKGLSQTYEGLGNKTEAYNWLLRYSKFNDSLHQTEIVNDLHDLEMKYQNAEKQKKITRLEAEKKEAVLVAKNQRLTNWMLGIAATFLLIVLAFVVIYYRNSRKLAKEKEINYKQQLKDIEQQQELNLTHALLEGEERERKRLARDLHDGLGGMLAGIKIKLSGQSKMEHNQNLDAVILQLDHSVNELRRIARNMMPESLLKTGLEAALRDLCESLTTQNMQIEFQAYGIRHDIPPVTQANIYRIVQEILSNAVKHADANKIVLQCSQNENIFLITAEDNGKGFDTSGISHSGGIGFSNIKNRVAYLKGNLDIASTLNEGTTVNIELNVS